MNETPIRTTRSKSRSPQNSTESSPSTSSTENDDATSSKSASASVALAATLSTETETDDIKLYDITPMDYFSKSQMPLSKTAVFRDELWRRRNNSQTHRKHSNGNAPANGNANGTANGKDQLSASPLPSHISSTPIASCSALTDIGSVLTRNMTSEDLKRLIEHQMVEAMKLTRLWTYRDSDSNDDTQAELESVLNKSCASLNVSVRRTMDFSTRKRRIRTGKISKAKNARRISL